MYVYANIQTYENANNTLETVVLEAVKGPARKETTIFTNV